MPNVLYQKLGWDKRLGDIVFAGSHDASITSGSAHAETQDLDIAGQADAGVRLFDLRILARKSAGGIDLVGYHGSPGGKSKEHVTITRGTGANARTASTTITANTSITGE